MSRGRLPATVKAARSEARRSFVNPLVVGQILHYSWGYDQTNADFYEVTATTAHSVTMREIAHTITGDGHSMTGRATPQPGEFIGPPLRKRVVSYNGNQPLVVMRHGYATPFEQPSARVSWYA